MGEVINVGFRTLKPNKPKASVWECGCGNQLWFLAPDGRCVCAACRCASTVIKVTTVDGSGDANG